MYVCVCIYIYVYIYTYIYTYIHTYMCMYIYIHVYMWVFICLYVHKYYPGSGRKMWRKERAAPGIVQSVLNVKQTRLITAHTQVVVDRS
jgi:hypothetical protein